jgi:hypothetical protein
MINFIRQATWIANLFRIKQNIKFYGVSCILGCIQRNFHRKSPHEGVFLNFFLPQPIIHIATIS